MEKKILLALALVALSFGYCKGFNNIYGDKYEKLFTKEKLERRLTNEFAPDAREVARLLVKADNKVEALDASKGVQIYKLLDWTLPDFYCRHVEFANFDRWRELLSGTSANDYLYKNIFRLEEICVDDIDREVARRLAKTNNKDEAFKDSNGVKLPKLSDFALPYEFCRRATFAKFEEWRELFSAPDGNAYLLNYVNENVDRLFKLCQQDIDKIFKRDSSHLSPEGEYSEQITKYAETTGEESYSQEKTVKNFLAAKILSEKGEQLLIKGCAALVPRVEESLSFFLKSEKEASAYLDNLSDTPEALLYKRCKVVNQISGKR